MPITKSFAGLSVLGFGILPGGAMESIATVTVGSGGTSSIEFASLPSGFQHLQIRAIGRTTTTNSLGSYFNVRFNSDSGSNYSYHHLLGDGSGVSASGLTSQGAAYAVRLTTGTQTTSVFGCSLIDILDYASTSKNKTMRVLGGWDSNGSGVVYVQSAAWLSTGAITSLTLTPDAGNFSQYSQFALYGIRS